ncbi:MAG TPA: hypothetical protein VN213_08565 [Solirubrobacteraceae bacterium]|nr:hypothetical protein [Solirubrobacteraceae bacterium]
MADERRRDKIDRDERVAIPLDPETALRGLLAVDPDAEPADDEHGAPAQPPAEPPRD